MQHVSRLIRNHLKRHGMSRTDFAAALWDTEDRRRAGSKSGMLSNWIRGRFAPGEEIRPRLAQILGVPEDELLPRRVSDSVEIAEEIGPARAVARYVPPPQPAPAPRPARPDRVFSITARTDGQMAVELSVVLPAAQGMALARYLMDFGLMTEAAE